jgi:hypothetical protein
MSRAYGVDLCVVKAIHVLGVRAQQLFTLQQGRSRVSATISSKEEYCLLKRP